MVYWLLVSKEEWGLDQISEVQAGVACVEDMAFLKDRSPKHHSESSSSWRGGRSIEVEDMEYF